jgi:hypothetical protein
MTFQLRNHSDCDTVKWYHTSTAQRAESRTSAKDSSPVSGQPARPAATLKPLRKLTGKPVHEIPNMLVNSMHMQRRRQSHQLPRLKCKLACGASLGVCNQGDPVWVGHLLPRQGER